MKGETNTTQQEQLTHSLSSGCRGHSYQFFESSGPLRGFKRSLHEGGVRSPLIVRWVSIYLCIYSMLLLSLVSLYLVSHVTEAWGGEGWSCAATTVGFLGLPSYCCKCPPNTQSTTLLCLSLSF